MNFPMQSSIKNKTSSVEKLIPVSGNRNSIMRSWRAKATGPRLADGDAVAAMAVSRIVTVATLILKHQLLL